jgi:hypothetical protein
MRKLTFFGTLALAILSVTASASAQNRPFIGPDPEIVAPGDLRVEAGFDFLQHVSYPLSGLSGDQTNVGVVDLRLGLAKMVEVQLTGNAREFLQIKHAAPSLVPLALPHVDSTSDTGDFSLLTKIRIAGEDRARPAFAFRFGFTMPNTNQARGLGNNAIDVSAEVIAGKHFGRLATFGSAGLAILTAPNEAFTQNDEILYGVGAGYPIWKQVKVVAEVAGRHSTRKITPALAGTESRGQGRLGVQIVTGGLTWDAAAIAGIYRNDPHTGFTVGVSHDFHIFGGKKAEQ